MNKQERNKYLYEEQKKLAKRANQRIRELEKRGYAKDLRNITRLTKGKNRFATKKGTNQQMQRNIDRINTFLGQKSSTIRGYESILNARSEVLAEKYAEETGGEKNIEAWDRFLRSNEFKESMKLLDSDIVMETFQNSLNDIGDYDKIIGAYKRFVDREDTFDSVIADIGGRNPFLP